MQPGIYFVGGASGAGKTTVTKNLSHAFSVPVVELDDFQRLLMTAVPTQDHRHVAMRKIAYCVTEQLLEARTCSIVDGSWIEPEQAAELRSHYGAAFHPVYCGYGGQDLSSRLSDLRSKGSHWLARESQDAAAAFMQKQVHDSEKLRSECMHWAMSYYDFTSYTTGSKALRSDFERWLA